MNIGAMIAAITIAALIALAADRPPASRLVQTDYCAVDQPVMARNPRTGKSKKMWVPGYAPCSQQDIYREI